MVSLLGNPVAVMFLSFILGMIGNAILRRVAIYRKFSDLYLFSGSKTYERLGVLWYRRVLLATPLRFFNQDIRFSANRSLETLESVRVHMVNAEVSHWVAFAIMLGFSVTAWWYYGFKMALAFLVFNMLGNVYPCLLQQYNRRRLSRLITASVRRSKRSAD